MLAQCGDDLADDAANLVVGVGGREDPVRRRLGGGGRVAGGMFRRRRRRRRDRGIGPAGAGEDGDDAERRGGVGEGAQHPGLGPVEVLRQVQDEVAELVGGRRPERSRWVAVCRRSVVS